MFDGKTKSKKFDSIWIASATGSALGRSLLIAWRGFLPKQAQHLYRRNASAHTRRHQGPSEAYAPGPRHPRLTSWRMVAPQWQYRARRCRLHMGLVGIQCRPCLKLSLCCSQNFLVIYWLSEVAGSLPILFRWIETVSTWRKQQQLSAAVLHIHIHTFLSCMYERPHEHTSYMSCVMCHKLFYAFM